MPTGHYENVQFMESTKIWWVYVYPHAKFISPCTKHGSLVTSSRQYLLIQESFNFWLGKFIVILRKWWSARKWKVFISITRSSRATGSQMNLLISFQIYLFVLLFWTSIKFAIPVIIGLTYGVKTLGNKNK